MGGGWDEDDGFDYCIDRLMGMDLGGEASAWNLKVSDKSIVKLLKSKTVPGKIHKV